jgi:hypothetical protein
MNRARPVKAYSGTALLVNREGGIAMDIHKTDVNSLIYVLPF